MGGKHKGPSIHPPESRWPERCKLLCGSPQPSRRQGCRNGVESCQGGKRATGCGKHSGCVLGGGDGGRGGGRDGGAGFHEPWTPATRSVCSRWFLEPESHGHCVKACTALKDQVGTETGMVAFLLGPPSLLTRKPSEKLVWKFCHFQAFLILSCDLLSPFSAVHAPVKYSLYCQPPREKGENYGGSLAV